MSVCPKCQQPHGRAELRVWCAMTWWPATCEACGARFYPARTRSALVSELAFLPFGLIASAASPNLVVAAIFILGFAVAYLAVRTVVPLVLAEEA
jgi:hypothetical protein